MPKTVDQLSWLLGVAGRGRSYNAGSDALFLESRFPEALTDGKPLWHEV